MFNGSVYGRGALTLHALRLRLGDEIFFEILQTYSKQYKYETAGTADFMALAGEVSGDRVIDCPQYIVWPFQGPGYWSGRKYFKLNGGAVFAILDGFGQEGIDQSFPKKFNICPPLNLVGGRISDTALALQFSYSTLTP